MKGSIRQRSAGSWELTVDLGRDSLGRRSHQAGLRLRAGQPSIRRYPFLRARGKVRMEAMSLLPSPLANPPCKCELLCYSVPMKSVTGPLLFLGACRITSVLGANHGKSPCGRGAEGTTQGARPSEEGRRRSERRCEASSLEPSGAATDPRRLNDGSTTAKRRPNDG